MSDHDTKAFRAVLESQRMVRCGGSEAAPMYFTGAATVEMLLRVLDYAEALEKRLAALEADTHLTVEVPSL